jgi:hypothetical protein
MGTTQSFTSDLVAIMDDIHSCMAFQQYKHSTSQWIWFILGERIHSTERTDCSVYCCYTWCTCSSDKSSLSFPPSFAAVSGHRGSHASVLIEWLCVGIPNPPPSTLYTYFPLIFHSPTSLFLAPSRASSSVLALQCSVHFTLWTLPCK